MERPACIVSPSAEDRLAAARAWLAGRALDEELLVVGATLDAASELIRDVAAVRGAGFGWHRATLGRLATTLALPALTERGLAPAGALPIEALCARVAQQLRETGRASRLAAVADQPGIARALARTLSDLRLARVGATGDADLDAALAMFDAELASARLVDRAAIYALAEAAARAGAAAHPLLGHPIVFVDVPLRTIADEQFVAALIAHAPDVLVTVPRGDERTLAHLAALSIVPGPEAGQAAPDSALRRVQQRLFARAVALDPQPLDESVAIFSAPGESRECVEIARRIVREAARGVPFDRMAVLLRTTTQYRVHLQEALARAGIPAHFEQGTLLPDPSGRAFLALLACAAEGLSARRFAEYLSLGEVPDATPTGSPPDAPPAGDRWVAPDDDLLPAAVTSIDANETRGDASPTDPSPPTMPPSTTMFASTTVLAATTAPSSSGESIDDAPVAAGTLRAPWRWERLLVESAVIGGRDRWARRLAGLAARLEMEGQGEIEREQPIPTTSGEVRLESLRDQRRAESRERMLRDLRHLQDYALPLIDDLATFPAAATWGEWLERLTALATRALRRPERVLAVLNGMAPMAAIGPVGIAEVLATLRPRLADLVERPTTRRYGRVLVAPIEGARGLACDVVFVPGLAERVFPQRIAEDPLLLDARRRQLGRALHVREDRLAEERLALRIAVGCARTKAVLSYPRINLEESRPRVPSFYGLEVLQAAEGVLPGFDELGVRAEATGAARIGWPAPAVRTDAIDEAEHDLAYLDELFAPPGPPPKGAARYLLDVNPHLARALRMRARRWTVSMWTHADGLVEPEKWPAEARAALAENALEARAFSPTALEQFASCPYRFVLRALVGLPTREQPEPVESIGAIERGSLVHDVQFELLGELRAANELPVRAATLDAARVRLDAVLDRVAEQYRDTLFPAIERVWNDGVAAIRADLREWLRRMVDDTTWVPRRFELAFGEIHRASRDPASVGEPVPVADGLRLQGSIDLVEERSDGVLRATDHKTGAARVAGKSIIDGGKSLQPVLYAAVLERLVPGAQVAGGRLYYCTTRGEFRDVMVVLDDAARASLRVLVETLRSHFDRGFFPAAPVKDACKVCDFRRICGPYEELRASKKQKPPLVPLDRLRGMR